MAKEKFIVSGDQINDIDSQMSDIKRQLRLTVGSPLDPELVKRALQKIVEGIFSEDLRQLKTKSSFYQEKRSFNIREPKRARLSYSEHYKQGFSHKCGLSYLQLLNKVVLKDLDGRRLLWTEDTPKERRGANLESNGMLNLGVATPQTAVGIYEFSGNAKYSDIFASFLGSWENKWLSQNQIMEFNKRCFNWLENDGSEAICLMKKDESKPVDKESPENNLMFGRLSLTARGVAICGSRFNCDWMLWSDELRRIICPVY